MRWKKGESLGIFVRSRKKRSSLAIYGTCSSLYCKLKKWTYSASSCRASELVFTNKNEIPVF
jgi:hypothetical protein